MEEAVQALLAALNHSEMYMRVAAAAALADLGAGSPEVVQALLAACRDQDSYVRGAAWKAVRKLTSARVGDAFEDWD